MRKLERALPVTIGAAAIVAFIGIFQSLQTGAADFQVFYYAWKLVLAGQSHTLYRDSPDLFLYAYPFAWWLSPLAYLPFKAALLVWQGLKLSLLALAFMRVQKTLNLKRGAEWVLLLAFLFCARPVLNELRYGQFNLILLGLGLLAWSDHKRGTWLALFMAALAVKPVLALFGIPTLLIWALNERTRLRVFVIAALLFLVPYAATALIHGVDATQFLVAEWMRAIRDKGFPTQTHNQSISAVFYRVFSGESFVSLLSQTPIYFWGESQVVRLSALSVRGMSLGLSLTLIGLYLGLCLQLFIVNGAKGEAARLRLGLFLFTGALLPLHLVWKPYFVFLIPLMMLLFTELHARGRVRKRELGFYAAIFFLLNFLNPIWVESILGRGAAIRAEAIGLSMLVLYLLWLRAIPLARRYSVG